MATSPSQYSLQSQSANSPEATKSTMLLGVQNPPQLQELPWNRGTDLPFRIRSPPERVDLPPIRAMLPDAGLGKRAQSRTVVSPPSAATITRQPQSGLSRSPASYKRRKLSSEEDLEAEQRDATTPRWDRRSTQQSQSTTIFSTRPSNRRASGFSDPCTSQQQRTSSYASPGFAPGIHTQSVYENAPRPFLPSLPGLAPPATIPNPRSSTEYTLDSSRPKPAQIFPQFSHFDAPVAQHRPGAAYANYGYQQPRGQPYPGPSPYKLGHEGSSLSVNVQHGYSQPGNSNGDSSEADKMRRRKRRGNLPKETIEKLRAWFLLHLHHPYPTEDEKQVLMRDTGLQMNQISNWFINARRRQLPQMINNARAESNARARPVPGDASEYQDEERGSGGSGDSDEDRESSSETVKTTR